MNDVSLESTSNIFFSPLRNKCLLKQITFPFAQLLTSSSQAKQRHPIVILFSLEEF